MQRKLGFLVLAIAATVLLIAASSLLRVNYWIQSPREKFYSTWSEDMLLLQKSGGLPNAWNQIREIRITTDNSPVQEWLDYSKVPIKRNPNGMYRLEIVLAHWIQNYRYGVMFQYELIDLKAKNNVVWHLGRTHPLGFVY